MKTKRSVVKIIMIIIVLLFLLPVGVEIVDWLIFPAYKACWDCISVRPSG